MTFQLIAPPATANNSRPITASILRVLAYFDVFDFPLTAKEIREYCDYTDVNLYQVQSELDMMRLEGLIQHHKGYYFIGSEVCVQKRHDATKNVAKYTRKALFYSRVIAHFPFVRAVAISGSLSKGCADKDADIDYFIITSPGRLWLCRTLLTLFKKTFLFNSRKYFCINYFIDTEHMDIPDKNLFTATEIAFLLPTYHYGNYKRFMDSNNWIQSFYPNKAEANPKEVIAEKNSFFKRSLEVIFGGKLGSWLEQKCFSLNIQYRRWKFRHMERTDFHLRLRATRGVSKHHPNSFQQRVLEAYHTKLKYFQSALGIQVA